MNKKESFNLEITNYEMLNSNTHLFSIRIDNLFNLNFKMTYNKPIIKKNKKMQDILNATLFNPSSENIIKLNKNFLFTNHEINDINYIVMYDYYKIKNDNEVEKFINKKYFSNQKLMNIIQNFYALSAIKKSGDGMKIFI
jgi:hypothetical protein